MTARPLDPESRRRPAREVVALMPLLALLIAMAIVPMVSAVELKGNNSQVVDAKNISLTIVGPNEGEYVYIDVGALVTINLDVYSPDGIQDVSISNGINQSKCQINFDQKYYCKNPSHEGKNSITVTVVDNAGRTISQTRNYFFYFGQMPPPRTNPSPLRIQLGAPKVSAAENNITSSDNKGIIINVSYPLEREIILMGDVVMSEYSILVLGNIDSPNDIKTLQIKNGIDDKKCSVKNDGKNVFSCELPVYRNSSNFTLTIIDNQGNRVIKTQNFTPYYGIPPLENVCLFGVVLDIQRNPVSNVSISFNDPTSQEWDEKSKSYKPYYRESITDINGDYRICGKEMFSQPYHQIISITKEGYTPIIQEITIEPVKQRWDREKELNFTLSSETKQTSGFSFITCISAALICILLLKNKSA